MKTLTKNRLEAFTDGVVAIVLTVLVLNIQFPKNPSWEAVREVSNPLLAYAISFLFVSAIWVSHHRLFSHVKHINLKVIWANLFWLFWLTLCPSVTAWVGEYPMEVAPEICYAIVYLMWSVSFSLITKTLVDANRENGNFLEQVKRDKRSKISIVMNFLIFPFIFIFPPSAMIGRFVISGIWIFPIEILHKTR